MPGPVSTNAPFSEFGQSMILRDIEMLYLLVNQSTGDLGKQPIQSSDVDGNGTNLQNGGGFSGPWTQPQNPSKSGTKVKYLGTLDLPIFGKSVSVKGNAAGLEAVDWQQRRGVATQVASGSWSSILGGLNNTASGQYSSVPGGSGNTASGDYSFAVGSSSTASASQSFSVNGTASALRSMAFYGTSVGSNCAAFYSTMSGAGTFDIAFNSIVSTSNIDNSIFIGSNPGSTFNATNTAGGSKSGCFINCSGTIDMTVPPYGTVFIGCSAVNSSYGFDANAIQIGCGNNLTGTISIGVNSSWGTATENVRIGQNARIRGTLVCESSLTVTSTFGCNGATSQSAFTSGGAVTNTAGATYTATEQAMLGQLKTLANNIRTALVNNGIMS
jgi:hypothetical protein